MLAAVTSSGHRIELQISVVVVLIQSSILHHGCCRWRARKLDQHPSTHLRFLTIELHFTFGQPYTGRR